MPVMDRVSSVRNWDMIVTKHQRSSWRVREDQKIGNGGHVIIHMSQFFFFFRKSVNMTMHRNAAGLLLCICQFDAPVSV